MRKVEREETKVENLEDLLNKAQEYMGEMREMLKDIRVPAEDPQVLEAVRNIFGNTYIHDGRTYITFEMFLDCLNITRNVGRAVAAEFA